VPYGRPGEVEDRRAGALKDGRRHSVVINDERMTRSTTIPKDEVRRSCERSSCSSLPSEYNTIPASTQPANENMYSECSMSTAVTHPDCCFAIV
jgi:hypothetical protein